MELQLDQIERSIYEFLKTHPNSSLDEIHSNLKLDMRLIKKAVNFMEKNDVLMSFLRWEPKKNEAVNIYSIKNEVDFI